MMSLGTRRRRDERGVEAVAMIIVIPVMVVLVLALIDVGMMFRGRMLIENVTRDAVRSAAADGGLYNGRTNTIGESWDAWLTKQMVKNHNCTMVACQHGQIPTVDCYNEDSSGARYNGSEINKAGDLVLCHVHYPYEPINGGLLNGPIGLGMGSLLKPFDITVAARSETSKDGTFGVLN